MSPSWLLIAPLLIAGLVDVPRGLAYGGFTMLAVLTLVQLAIAVAGLLALASYPKVLLRYFVPFALFLGWLIVRSLVEFPSRAGLQNGLVYLLFGVQFVLAGTLAARWPALTVSVIERGVFVLEGLALAFVALGIAMGRSEDAWLVGARSIGLLAIFPVSWHLARWQHGYRGAGLRALVWIIAVLASRSRMAIMVLLVNAAIVLAIQLSTKPSRLLRSVPDITVAVVTLGLAVAWQADVLYERFFGGYTTVEIGTVSISTSGRSHFWPVVIESAMQHPIVGNGLGSSNSALWEFDSSVVGHPHNEYLRIWHDGGLVALAFLLIAFCGWLLVLWRGWRHSTRTGAPLAEIELAAFLTLVGIMLAAITDNGFIYSFVMAPSGLLIGAALGLRLLQPCPDFAVNGDEHVPSRRAFRQMRSPRWQSQRSC